MNLVLVERSPVPTPGSSSQSQVRTKACPGPGGSPPAWAAAQRQNGSGKGWDALEARRHGRGRGVGNLDSPPAGHSHPQRRLLRRGQGGVGGHKNRGALEAKVTAGRGGPLSGGRGALAPGLLGLHQDLTSPGPELRAGLPRTPARPRQPRSWSQAWASALAQCRSGG